MSDFYMDDVRWTQGVCRYPGGTTFDPPSREGDEYYSSTILLLKGEGADGQTTTVDSSPYNHTMVRDIGDGSSILELDTAIKHCGISSLLLNHDDVADSTGWTSWNATDSVFAKGDANDFTAECWFYWDGSDGGNGNYLFHWSGGISIIISGNQFSANRTATFTAYRAGVSPQIFAGSVGSPAWSDNTWTHVAIARDGATLYGYINGVSVGTPVDLSTNIVGFATTTAYVGSRGSSGSSFPGAVVGAAANSVNIDDVRFTDGICRYPGGTTFTPACADGAAPVGFPVTKWQRYQG